MPNPTLQVASKELREMLRDKRVRSSAFFGPFILVFMLLFLFGTVIKAVSKPSSMKIHVVQPKGDNPLVKDLKQKNVNVVTVSSLAEGEKLVKDGKAVIVLEFEDDYSEKVASGQPTTITALYDSKEQRSQIALSALQREVQRGNEHAVQAIFEARGIPKELSSPIQVKSVDATRAKGASDLLTSILPYLIVIWAFFGGMSVASDLVAGEKERTTLETLLITPVARTQIVLGKFLALATVCFTSSLSSLVAVLIFATLKLPGSDVLFKDGTGITAGNFLATIAVLIPAVILFAGILIAISSYAKNSREAQSYLGLASFAVTMPAVSSQFIGFTDLATARWINLIPVLNTANSIRSALLGKVDVINILITIAVGVVIGVAMILVAVKLFTREQVLTRI